MSEPSLSRERYLTFKGSRYWTWNVWAAVIAGISGSILMCAVVVVVLSGAPSLKALLFTGAWVLILLLTAFAWFPGNAIASFPYEVVVEKRRGLHIRAPFKELYIPIDNIQDVRSSSLRGFVVRLKRRHRLLTQIVIHRFFGREGKPLADTIREEIRGEAS